MIPFFTSGLRAYAQRWQATLLDHERSRDRGVDCGLVEITPGEQQSSRKSPQKTITGA